MTNPNDPKNGRELMQIKINNISANKLERGEIKFDIEYPTEIKSPEDSHPMLGMVKRSHRKDFKQWLVKMGLDPYSMRPILTVKDLRTRFYILATASPSCRSRMIRRDPVYCGQNTTGSRSSRRRTSDYMTKINLLVTNAIKERFPEIQTNLTPKYNKAFHAFESQIPQLRFLVRTNMNKTENLAGAGILSLVLLGGGSFVFLRKTSSRKRE